MRGWRYFGKYVGINLGLIVLVAVLLLWLVSVWLSAYTRQDERVLVPDVTGMSEYEAEYTLSQLGLAAVVVDSVYADVKPGAVVEQLPVAELPVKTGRMVYLTINSHTKKMITMVDVEQVSRRQAASKLREQGFVIAQTEMVPSEFDDLVVKITTADGADMPPGRKYPYHTQVIMQVGSSALMPDSVTVQEEIMDEDWMQ